MIHTFFETFKTLLRSNDDKDKQSLLRENILREYKELVHTYETFSVIMNKLIESILVQNGYKYQLHVRVKDIQRLEEKIKRKQALGKNYYSLKEIEDLVGIRVIFYTELDKQAFIKDIKREISGTMRLEEKKQKNGYSATHIIISFGKKRLRLAEYKAFAGLKCEIQITSAIHHAWAELEHDIIYKDINGLEKTSPEKYHLAKKKLSEILEKHITTASEEFEKVIEEIRH